MTEERVTRTAPAARDAFGWAILGLSLLISVLTPAGLFLLPVSALVLFRRRFGRVITSPVWITTGILGSLGAGGYILYGRGPLIAANGASLQLDQNLAAPTVKLMVVSTSGLLIGALITAGRPQARVSYVTRSLATSDKAKKRLLFGCCIPLLLALPATPVLLRRDTYLSAATGGFALSAVSQLGSVALVVLGYLTVTTKGTRRMTSFVLVAFYAMVFLALGSRRLAIVPLLFAVGSYAGTPGRTGRNRLLVASALALALVPIPLYLRGLPEHGFIPYVRALPAIGSAYDPLVSLYNITFSFPVTGTTAFVAPPHPFHDLVVELNPLPGRLSGWYAIAPSMRINLFVPFSGLGEIGQQSLIVVSLVWTLLGAALGYFDRRCTRLLQEGRQLAAFSLTGLSALFAIFVTQYNLRNASRFIYYALAVDISLRFLAFIRAQELRPEGPRRRWGPSAPLDT